MKESKLNISIPSVFLLLLVVLGLTGSCLLSVSAIQDTHDTLCNEES